MVEYPVGAHDPHVDDPLDVYKYLPAAHEAHVHAPPTLVWPVAQAVQPVEPRSAFDLVPAPHV